MTLGIKACLCRGYDSWQDMPYDTLLTTWQYGQAYWCWLWGILSSSKSSWNIICTSIWRIFGEGGRVKGFVTGDIATQCFKDADHVLIKTDEGHLSHQRLPSRIRRCSRYWLKARIWSLIRVMGEERSFRNWLKARIRNRQVKGEKIFVYQFLNLYHSNCLLWPAIVMMFFGERLSDLCCVSDPSQDAKGGFSSGMLASLHEICSNIQVHPQHGCPNHPYFSICHKHPTKFWFSGKLPARLGSSKASIRRQIFVLAGLERTYQCYFYTERHDCRSKLGPENCSANLTCIGTVDGGRNCAEDEIHAHAQGGRSSQGRHSRRGWFFMG